MIDARNDLHHKQKAWSLKIFQYNVEWTLLHPHPRSSELEQSAKL